MVVVAIIQSLDRCRRPKAHNRSPQEFPENWKTPTWGVKELLKRKEALKWSGCKKGKSKNIYLRKARLENPPVNIIRGVFSINQVSYGGGAQGLARHR